MKLRDFLALVTPEAGIKYAAELFSFTVDNKTINSFKHTAFDDIGAWAANLLDMDEEGRSMYFALAGYSEPVQKVDRKTGQPVFTRGGKPKMQYRTQQLAVAAKSVWIDLDCSEEKAAQGLGYASQKEAISALAAFVKEAALPTPLIVNSGYGVHCYWPFVEDVPAKQWSMLAQIWRQVLNVYQVRSDASRDIDIASVLRPPGTHNRKRDAVREVAVVNKTPVAPIRVGEFARMLKGAMASKGASLQAPRSNPHEVPSYAMADRSDDLAGMSTQLPSYASQIVVHCNQLLQFHQSMGDVEEPIWRGALGLLKHTEEGEDLAHEWSSGHRDYNEADTQAKLDGWEAGPTTCAYFCRVNAKGCEGCGHKDKIKSPIQLGYKTASEPSRIPAVETEVDGVAAVMEGVTLPKGYIQGKNGGLAFLKVDGDGVVHPVSFSRSTFYPIMRVKLDDGTYAYRFRVVRAGGAVSTFDVPAHETATPALIEVLASYEVFMTDVALTKYMRQYVTDFCAHMAETAAEVRTYAQFGWHDDRKAFVLGEREYGVDGTVRQSILGGNAMPIARAFDRVAPDVTDWVDAVNFIYNRQGMEHMQYALCSGFGSLLGTFQSDLYAGIPLALTDPSSGRGKTTVCKMALMAFGNWRSMTISTKEGATPMARIATLAAHGNVPVLIDEVTDIEANDLASFLYAVSNGRDRLRLHTSGKLRDSLTWNLSAYLTANESLTNKLNLLARDAEANQVRIFEVSTREYPGVRLDSTEVDKAVAQAANSTGAPGDRFIRFVVEHQEVVMQLMDSIKTRMREASPHTDAPQWRFFRYHTECTLAAAAIMKKLKLIQFDLAAMQRWAVGHLQKMCQAVEEQRVEAQSLESVLAAFLTEARKHFLVTYGFRRGNEEQPITIPHEAVYGRYIVGEENSKTPKWFNNTLLVSRGYLKRWCATAGVDYMSFLSELNDAGYFKLPPGVTAIPDEYKRAARFYLTQGTPLPGSQVFCHHFDMAKIAGATAILKAV